MQAPNWTDFLQCSICTGKFDQLEVLPISLSCGHTLCTRCLGKLKTRTCPYDKVAIRPDVEAFPPNTALLQLLGCKLDLLEKENTQVLKLNELDQVDYARAVLAIKEVAMFLQPLAEHGITAAITYLTKPMLKKLVTVVNCQILDLEGRVRAVRAARSIADRAVTELLVMHQNQQQISTLLWTAVRNRGCQFLGPVMQEEALKLILRVLESGNSLSRKNIVLFVVQRLSGDFPQASKTSVGHVVQLLYRASCFNVEKRDDDSSLMQLKEEFRSYECLRREHDGQIIRMAMEAGLRISPEQWSTLLYGDHKHKSDMQSIIDKLISQGAASSGLSELIVAIGRSQDPYQLSEKVVPHLETIFKVPINPEKTTEMVEWESFASVMEALLATLHGFSTYMKIQNGRFKTGMCPYLSKQGGCPKGERCTYAHTEEERDRFRNMVKPAKLTKPRSGDQFSRSNVGGRRSGDHGPVKAHTDTHASSLNAYDLLTSGQSSAPEQHFSEFIRYSGEQLRLGGRPASLTAPVLSNQEWHNLPRGIATIEHPTYHTTDNGLAPYLSAEQVYAKPLPSEHLQPYAVSQPLSKIELIRLQHEAVKQSVEASAYSRELRPPSAYMDSVQYPQREWLTPVMAESQSSLPSSYNSDPFSLPSGQLIKSGSMLQESLVDQQVLSGMESLDLSRPPSTYSSTSSHPNGATSGFLSPAHQAAAAAAATVQNLNVCTAPTAPTISSASTSPSAAGEGQPANVSNTATVSTGSQNELEAEIGRLREQLKVKEQTIQQQSAQLQGHGAGGVTTVVPDPRMGIGTGMRARGSVAPLTNSQYSTQVYSNGMGVVMAGEDTTQPTGAPLFPGAPHSYSAPIQYSNKQLQAAAAAMAAALVGSQPTSAQYYPSTAPPPPPATLANSYPHHQWSGPQSGVPPGPAAYPHNTVSVSHQTTITPPNTGYIMSAAAPLTHQLVLPSSTRQPHALLDLSDDGMLAAYIQMMEQSKAAGASGPTYQAPPTYNPLPPQGHYYYPHHH